MRYWRAEIQGYIHAYRAVTGVDVTDAQQSTRFTPPSVHLRNRLASQRAGALPAAQPAGLPAARPLPVPTTSLVPRAERNSER